MWGVPKLCSRNVAWHKPDLLLPYPFIWSKAQHKLEQAENGVHCDNGPAGDPGRRGVLGTCFHLQNASDTIIKIFLWASLYQKLQSAGSRLVKKSRETELLKPPFMENMKKQTYSTVFHQQIFIFIPFQSKHIKDNYMERYWTWIFQYQRSSPEKAKISLSVAQCLSKSMFSISYSAQLFIKGQSLQVFISFV